MGCLQAISARSNGWIGTALSHLVVHCLGLLKGELSTGQATGQMANKRVYVFIFRKTPFWGITVVYRRLLVFIDIPAYIADGFCTL